MNLRFVSWLSLPLIGLSLTFSNNLALADTSLPVPQIVKQLRQKTKVPILVPSVLPGSNEKIFVYSEASSKGYYLSFDLIADCKGATACRVASLEAERGGKPYLEKNSETVKLTNGIVGSYTLIKGPYYTALVQWQSRGVLYAAAVKNGRKQDAIALANAAIKGGNR